MEASIIGLIGIIAGVILTSLFQLINKYIDYRVGVRNRWVEDRKQTYADFLMHSNTWFRHALIVSRQGVSQKFKDKHTQTITDSRIELNIVLAMINVIAGKNVVDKTESFNDWMQAIIKLSNENRPDKLQINKYIQEFVEKRADVTNEFRKDL